MIGSSRAEHAHQNQLKYHCSALKSWPKSEQYSTFISNLIDRWSVFELLIICFKMSLQYPNDITFSDCFVHFFIHPGMNKCWFLLLLLHKAEMTLDFRPGSKPWVLRCCPLISSIEAVAWLWFAQGHLDNSCWGINFSHPHLVSSEGIWRSVTCRHRSPANSSLCMRVSVIISDKMMLNLILEVFMKLKVSGGSQSAALHYGWFI